MESASSSSATLGKVTGNGTGVIAVNVFNSADMCVQEADFLHVLKKC